MNVCSGETVSCDVCMFALASDVIVVMVADCERYAYSIHPSCRLSIVSCHDFICMDW